MDVNQSVDFKTLAEKWDALGLKPLPDGFSWARLCRRYQNKARSKLNECDELREALQAENAEDSCVSAISFYACWATIYLPLCIAPSSNTSALRLLWKFEKERTLTLNELQAQTFDTHWQDGSYEALLLLDWLELGPTTLKFRPFWQH